MSGTYDEEPRVRLLSGDSGRTFAQVGLVVMDESWDAMQRLLASPPESNRGVRVRITYLHEAVHFIQAISSPYLLNHSAFQIDQALALLKCPVVLADRRQWGRSGFVGSARALEARASPIGLATRDLLEAAAHLASFKLARARPTVGDLLDYNAAQAGAGRLPDVYVDAFQDLAIRIGPEPAFELFEPIAFLSLLGDDPVASYAYLVQDWLAHENLSTLMAAPVAELMRSARLGNPAAVLAGIEALPPDLSDRYPIAAAALAAKRQLGERLLEVAARPSRVEKLATSAALEYLQPPMVAWSSAPGRPLQGHYRGVARDECVRSSMLRLLALVGAAERLTLYRDGAPTHPGCAHRGACPHHDTGLCFRYMAPPSRHLGWERCQFINDFHRVSGYVPADLMEAI